MSLLVTVAHGTRVASGNDVARRLTSAAAARLGADAVASYVELSEPLVADVMAASAGPSVVVPLLLSTGYHVKVDLPAAVSGSSAPAVLTSPLGPHPLLAAAMADRLSAAGARRGDPIVMAAAGSNDPEAALDLAEAARLLQSHWGAPVVVATVAGAGGLSMAEAVEAARGESGSVGGRVAVAPYLLAPGLFSRRAQEQGREAGAAVVADVIGDHALVVELVTRRYRAALRRLAVAA